MRSLAFCARRGGELTMKRTLRIGVSARLLHPRPRGTGMETKTLAYLEPSVAQWIMARDVPGLMSPSVAQDGMLNRSAIRLSHYAKILDGLVLQGGAPTSFPPHMAKRKPAPNCQATKPEACMKWNCSMSSSRLANRCSVSVAAPN